MPESQQMTDEPAREAVRQGLDRTLFVEAGAGTGKTTELVNRVLALLETGRTEITNIAAITFTEAAAADLRSRVHAELVKRAASPDASWARTALGGLDEASMTTIHGFAQRILSDHPLSAGLPLRFKVLDEIESQLEFERRFSGFIESLVGDDEGGELVAAARAIGMTIDALEALAFEVDESWNRHRDFERPAPSIGELRATVDVTTREITRAMIGVIGIRGGCDDSTDRLASAIEGIEDSLSLQSPGDDWIDRLEWCCSIPKLNGAANAGKKTAWKEGEIEQARTRAQEFERVRADGVARLCGLVLGAVVERLATEAERAAQARRHNGELHFHDLLVFARDLLMSDAMVRSIARERYRYILVDEFQDTDPLQLEIVTLIAEDQVTGVPVPGKLFFVGDPRQSIYRFRNAQPEVYEAALADLVPEGPQLLTRNFRSVPALIDFVNSVFSRMFTKEITRSRGPDYAPLEADRSDRVDDPVVVLGADAVDKLTAGERREREAAEIADLITRAVRDGWTVVIDGEERPATFGDIVILVTRRSGLAQLEAALDARDIPFRADSPSLILRSGEVRDLLACLRAVDSPGDDAALIAALRTPLLAVGDDDLLRYRRKGGQWRIDLGPRADRSDPVVVAIDRLESIASRRFRLGVVGTLESIGRDLHAFELAATTRHAEESLRRLGFLIARARAYVDSGGTTIAGFLEWIDGQLRSRIRSAETAVGEGEGSVRILTVHTAKGLEFPIVVLAELGNEPSRQRSGRMVLFSQEGRPEARVRKGVETSGFAALDDEDKRLSDLEAMRLCYVGMTRARDHLIVSLHRSATNTSRPSLAERVAAALEGMDAKWTAPDTRVSAMNDEQVRVPTAPFDGPAATREGLAEWVDRRRVVAASAAKRTSVGASELDSLFGADGAALIDRAMGAERPHDPGLWRSPRAASAVGRAVHAVLQRVDLVRGEGLDDLALVEVDREGCRKEIDRVKRLVGAALGSADVRRAIASSKYWRELPISVPVGEGVLDAVLDLVYEDDGRIVVVDYKTDAVSSAEEAGEAAANYRLQAGAYALAVQSVLGRSVDRFAFLFLSVPEGPVSVDVVDLGKAREAAEYKMTEMFAGTRP